MADDSQKNETKTEGKKARTFDFMAMFEETRKTAMDRSQKVLADRESEPATALSEVDPSTTSQAPSKEGNIKAAIPSPNEDESDDEDTIGPPLPPPNEDEDDDMIGPPLPPSMNAQSSDDDESDEEEIGIEQRIPSTNEIVLEHGSKVVSALSMDPSGARLVAGGYDYEMKFWDFAGMDARLQSFRGLRPCESYPLQSLHYSTTGDTILVVAGNSQAKVLDRDGFEKMECKKGDSYVTDMAKTTGHCASLNSGCWHPKIREEFMTCSNDCTVRTWDISSCNKKHKGIMKPRSQNGRKTIPTACVYSPDGRYMAAACQDGSIQVWDHNKLFSGQYVNTCFLNRTAHTNGSETSCLCFSYDGKVLASRGGDDTLKLWDLRNFKKPLCVAEGLYNRYSMTDCVFSPDDTMVVTGVSVPKGETGGKLVFLDRQNLSRLSELHVSSSSVVRCVWHPKLNQIAVGCSDGNIKVFYDPDKSYRGAKLCAVKTKRKVQEMDFVRADHIITPYALPMFRQDRQRSTKKQLEKDRKDPMKSKRPELPVKGAARHGRIGQHGATLAQYVSKQISIRKPDDRDKDPRAAILRHAEEAAKNPYWVDPAYKESQPTKIFRNPDEDKTSDDEEPSWKKVKV